MWDVIGACEIEGSADSTIKDVVPNDLSLILDTICLPSTSPANAAWTMEKLIAAWKVIREIPQDKA